MKVKLTIMTLLACLFPAMAQAYEITVNEEFVPQSEYFYEQEIQPEVYAPKDEISFLETLGIGGDEVIGSRDDISDIDKPNHGNDVPLTDGILPLMALVSLYLLVKYTSRITHYRSQITHNNK